MILIIIEKKEIFQNIFISRANMCANSCSDIHRIFLIFLKTAQDELTWIENDLTGINLKLWLNFPFSLKFSKIMSTKELIKTFLPKFC